MDCLDHYDTEEESERDARYLEEQTEEWLASWADDFHSDEWLAAVSPLPAPVRELVGV